MSQHAHAVPADPPVPFFTKHHFLLRRLHSLSGIVPVGMFAIVHLFTNAQIFFANKEHDPFQHEIDFIHAVPALFYIEVALWLGIAFHAILGVAYMMKWVPNNKNYPYTDNWRYLLQRITAWIALVFIFFHIATLRWRWDFFGWFTPFYYKGEDVPGLDAAMESVPMTTPLTAYALQFSWLVVVFYLVGVLSIVYHWCNGLWTAAISWGATLTKGAQKRWGFACIGLAMALTVFSLAAVVGSLKFDLKNDTTPEQRAVLKHLIPNWDK